MDRINYYTRAQLSNCKGTLFLLTLSLLLLVSALCQASAFGAGEANPHQQDQQQDYASTGIGEQGLLSTVESQMRLAPETEQGTPSSPSDYWAESTIEHDGVTMQLSALVRADGATEILLDSADGGLLTIELDDFGFRVESIENGVSFQHDWVRPHGDMMALLASNARTTNYTDAGSAFEGMPLFYAAMDNADAVMSPATNQKLDLIWIASNLLSRWIGDGQDSEPKPVVTVEDEAVPPETVGECDIPDFAMPRAGRVKVSIPGAEVEVVAAESSLNANCITDNCISGDASLKREIEAGKDDGEGCPGYGTWFDEDAYGYSAKIAFHANAGTGDCTNGVADSARSGSISISASGFEAEIEATSDIGNGLSTKAELDGMVKICMDADLIWDDVTNVLATGEATASVD